MLGCRACTFCHNVFVHKYSNIQFRALRRERDYWKTHQNNFITNTQIFFKLSWNPRKCSICQQMFFNKHHIQRPFCYTEFSMLINSNFNGRDKSNNQRWYYVQVWRERVIITFQSSANDKEIRNDEVNQNSYRAHIESSLLQKGKPVMVKNPVKPTWDKNQGKPFYLFISSWFLLDSVRLTINWFILWPIPNSRLC